MASLTKWLFDNDGETVKLPSKPQPLTKKIRIPGDSAPFQIILGKHRFHCFPDLPLAAPEGEKARDWVLFDPDRFYSGIGGFARFKRGQSVIIGRDNVIHDHMFGFSKDVMRRHLKISNKKGDLIIKPLGLDGSTLLSALPEKDDREKFTGIRARNLKRLRKLLGEPIGILSPEEGLASLKRVNRILRKERYRVKNGDGGIGAVLELPERLTPVIVGDLQAQVDNLLKVLSGNGLIEGLTKDEACLIILGDAVHSEVDGQLEEMDSSVLIMDLIFRLKEHFPDNVFYLRGNHDSFSPDVGKGGVPQGILLRKRLREMRGKSYEKRMGVFFERLPYIVKSQRFIACHAGPARTNVSFDRLVNLRKNPKLAHELTWNRLRRQNNPAGYAKGDVKRFRKVLGVDKQTPLIVGHTPLSAEGNVWMDVGEIKNHHIVYSGHPHGLAVFIGCGRHMVPLEYSSEPLLDLVNKS